MNLHGNSGLRRAAAIIGIVVGLIAGVAVVIQAVRSIPVQADVATKAELNLLAVQLAEIRTVAVETRAEQDRRRQTVLTVPAKLEEFQRELAALRTDVTDRLARIEEALAIDRRGKGRR